MLAGEPVEAIRQRSPMLPWLLRSQRAFSESSLRGDVVLEDPFVKIVAPLVQNAEREVTAAARELSRRQRVPFEPDKVAGILLPMTEREITRMLGQVMVLELHAARLRGKLREDTSAGRYGEFIRALADPEAALGLLEDYPVLLRIVATRLDDATAAAKEFLTRLAGDSDMLRIAFGLEKEDQLVEFEPTGDSHRGARRVTVVTFASGVKIVYKPKPIAIEAHFQQLLEWLNERITLPAFRTITVVERGVYGWAEFVRREPCATLDGLRRFYVRQGGHLALLHVLAAVDFQYENVIAAGEFPVLVDLESLFHGVSPDRVEHLDEAEQFAEDLAGPSLLRTGLLPARVYSGDGGEGFDISGLGAHAGQLTPVRLRRWNNTGTDEMHCVFERRETVVHANLPTLAGAEVDVGDFGDELVDGFRCVYETLLRERETLLSPNGPLAAFHEDEVRCILRPTISYLLLLDSSYHPYFLGDGLDRDQRFDRLLAAAPNWPQRGCVLAAEREDLWRNDVPIFAARPDSRDLWTSTGERIPDFLNEPGLAAVNRRLKRLSTDDLAIHSWTIRTSIATLSDMTDPLAYRSYPTPESPTPATTERLLAAARVIGEHLDEIAIRRGDGATWIGATSHHGQNWRVAGVGPDLYDGLPGIILFLAYLGEILAEERFTALARTALSTMRHQVRRDPDWSPIGSFTGGGGVAYALAHLAALWADGDLLEEGLVLVRDIPGTVGQDSTFDVIGGAAGSIAVLSVLHRLAQADDLIAAAEACGDHLLGNAISLAGGIAWPARHLASQPLGGFAHGATGIAWALLELEAHTGAIRFREATVKAIEYERTLFDPKVGNWRDVRRMPARDPLMRAADGDRFLSHWCHGAAGIGLARLRLLRHWDDRRLLGEIQIALEATTKDGFGLNHSLCHGDLGNLDVLSEAARTLRNPHWVRQLDRRTAEVLTSLDRNGPICGYPFGLESPGLMRGLAGIGYGLLRLAEPERVPSVLALDPPSRIPEF